MAPVKAQAAGADTFTSSSDPEFEAAGTKSPPTWTQSADEIASHGEANIHPNTTRLTRDTGGGKTHHSTWGSGGWVV